MSGLHLLLIALFIIAVITVTVISVVLKNHQYKKYREAIEKLDTEKNLIASTPV